jgi:hypothetical protein
MDEIAAWLTGRLPEDWFTAAPTVTVDREEILVIGDIPAPDVAGEETALREAEAGRIKRHREDTRGQRMRIADEAEHRFGRKVAWGATCGETTQVFTSLAMPVMTRLRQPERLVLDTLVEAGIARSRADALAWSVRLVGKHNAEWIADLQNALDTVRQARANGPAA